MNTVDDIQVALMQLLNSVGKHNVEQKKESIHIIRERASLMAVGRKLEYAARREGSHRVSQAG